MRIENNAGNPPHFPAAAGLLEFSSFNQGRLSPSHSDYAKSPSHSSTNRLVPICRHIGSNPILNERIGDLLHVERMCCSRRVYTKVTSSRQILIFMGDDSYLAKKSRRHRLNCFEEIAPRISEEGDSKTEFGHIVGLRCYASDSSD
jgi:hypothetical protein